ncbi:PrgI family protein, partial [Blautia sp. AM47-4]
MAYVPVPKDLSKIKTKLAFNLTKRQLVCFS